MAKLRSPLRHRRHRCSPFGKCLPNQIPRATAIQPFGMLSSVTSTRLHALVCACCCLRRPVAAPCARPPHCGSRRTATCRRRPSRAGDSLGKRGTTRRATPLLSSLCRPCDRHRKRHAGYCTKKDGDESHTSNDAPTPMCRREKDYARPVDSLTLRAFDGTSKARADAAKRERRFVRASARRTPRAPRNHLTKR
jgi:hypothetical protein